jgi:ParB family chromosome partitioning protein
MSEQLILEPHPLAKLFPPMGLYLYKELKADIARNGLHNPIVLFEGRILDGWNRFRACREIGIPPDFVNYEGDDPVGFVASMNLNRRHLNLSQRAMTAATLADLKPGGDRTKPQNCGLSHGRVAAQFGVSKRLVDMASALLNSVASGQGRELAEQVFNGEMSLNKAMRLLKLAQLGSSSLGARQSRRANEIVLQAERLCRRMDLLVADVEKTTTPGSEIRRLLAHTCDRAKRYFGEQAERLRGSELLLLPIEDA